MLVHTVKALPSLQKVLFRPLLLQHLRQLTDICASTFCGGFCILREPEEEQHYDMPNFDAAT